MSNNMPPANTGFVEKTKRLDNMLPVHGNQVPGIENVRIVRNETARSNDRAVLASISVGEFAGRRASVQL
jgi:hypothetical protein